MLSSTTTWGVCIVLLLAYSIQRSRSKLRILDMDLQPIKVLKLGNVSRGTLIFQAAQISKRGEDLAADEPYVIRNGNRHEVVIHAAEHVREFLRRDAKDHVKPTWDELNWGDYFYRILGQCAGALEGKPWRSVRRCFDPQYTPDSAASQIPAFRTIIEKWLTDLKNDSLRSGVGRLVLNAPDACRVLPLRAIPLTFYGQAYDEKRYTELVRLSGMQAQAMAYALAGRWQMYRWFNLLPTPSRRHLESYHRDWKTFNLDILEQARVKKLKIPAEHVFKGVDVDNAISLDQYLQTLDEMIFTNIGITGDTIAFLLDQLATHPSFQQKLYEEIKAETSGTGGVPNSYIARQTTLLHYLCLECIRLRPAVWFSVPECTAVDKVIGRYKIPAKTPVVIDVRRLNTDALTWGAESKEFRPERFAQLSPNEYRHGFVRFELGSRVCLGRHMADVLMKVAVVAILEKYRVEAVEKNIGVREGDLAFIKRGD